MSAPRAGEPPRVFVLSGAGLSAESGLGTFRDLGGIWSQVRLEEVATPEAFAADPARVQAFYDARRAQAAAAEPNPAHRALARLQRAWPGRVSLVTQNVDDLLERAGAPEVIHMHGQLARALCAACGESGPWTGDLTADAACAACGKGGRLRPDVVWFGEMPYRLDEIGERLEAADLFVSIGTSGAVYPAAGFAREARALGVRTLELNLEPSEGARFFDETRSGRASEIVPIWVEEMLARA